MINLEVNKPFPLQAPQQEGAIMELWADGLIVLIQMLNLSNQELNSFKKSFDTYAFLEAATKVPITIWIFNFPNFPIDVNFNARIVKKEYLDNYLDTKKGVKNLVTFFLLDRNILKGIKAIGIHIEAVELFHKTIRKQLDKEYTKQEYLKYLNSIFKYTTKEIFEMGVKFKHDKR
ncbi:MAG: hypothetical protein A3K77_00845 [Euryarchaeota archaeon RBG_13_31_8]|nr:MAG: hypothetical protein A3K77_00845 [Euryarchaeota archaeon RBG_13_31_8]